MRYYEIHEIHEIYEIYEIYKTYKIYKIYKIQYTPITLVTLYSSYYRYMQVYATIVFHVRINLDKSDAALNSPYLSLGTFPAHLCSNQPSKRRPAKDLATVTVNLVSVRTHRSNCPTPKTLPASQSKQP